MTSKLRLADRTNDIFPILGFVAAMASLAMPLNAWLVAFILAGAVVAAVHHAEVIAHRVGEPFGTLILALAVTVIEVGLILTLMQAEPEKAQSLARDTVFAAVMVILNLLMGLCLLSGAIRHHEQRFQRTGIGAALATLTVLTVVTLVLPNFTSSIPGPFYSATQLGFVAAVSLILYATFALVQTVRHRDYFLPDGDAQDEPDAHAAPPSAQRTAISGALLLASLVAVVLLAKSLSPIMGALLADWGAPPAVLGVLIAALILAPEGLAAVRA
ncbi:MAG TPA: ionic transporter y4hA, partial [Sphingopyxis sp.]|nr:ionic transporter y4hA [Sphingopyxis sp.]